MRVAALYDIHANLPALEAVLRDVRHAGVDQVVIGGDVVPGPMPRETVECLVDLDLPVHFVHGNGELAVLAQMAAEVADAATYWGDPGAFWLLLGPDVQFRHTAYDLAKAAERIRATPYPQAEEMAQGVLHPPSEGAMLEVFGRVQLR